MLPEFIMSDSTRKRGRPSTGKQKAYRDRQRALIKQLKPKIPKIAISAEQTIKHYEMYKEKLEDALNNLKELLGQIAALKIENARLKIVK
jgi:tRNA U34 5-carboxymethylaminomethyl modifying GTPase MnmE/TrmE